MRAMRPLTLAGFVAAAMSVAGSAHAQTLFQRNFNTGSSPGFDSTFPSTIFSIDPTGGPDGTPALRTVGNGSTFEAFWNVAGGAPVSDGVFRLSYDHRVNNPGFAGSRLHLMGTYNDAVKGRDGVPGQYRPLFAIKNSLNNPADTPPFAGTPDEGPTTFEAYGEVHYGVGQVVDFMGAFPATNLTSNTYRHVQQFVSLRQILADGAARATTRVLSIDRSDVLGSVGNNEVNPFAGGSSPFVAYGRYEMRAIQFFNSGGNTQTGRPVFTGFGVTNWFDNVRFDRITVADIDQVFADIRNNVASRDSDYNNDNLLTADDGTIFIEEVIGTRPGDANLDFAVDFDDLGLLLGAYDQSSGWGGGDFDGDGIVTFDDLGVLLGNYGFGVEGAVIGQLDAQAAALLASVAVPEPTFAGIAAGLALAGLRRRRD